MASRSLDDLDSRMRIKAEALIAACTAASIPVTIITTMRTLAEQAEAVKHGVSWTMQSKHLAHQPEGKSLAIDLAPTELLTVKNWAPAHPIWWQLGFHGQTLGLRWGGDWNDIGPSPVGTPRPRWDPGHFELR